MGTKKTFFSLGFIIIGFEVRDSKLTFLTYTCFYWAIYMYTQTRFAFERNSAAGILYVG